MAFVYVYVCGCVYLVHERCVFVASLSLSLSRTHTKVHCCLPLCVCARVCVTVLCVCVWGGVLFFRCCLLHQVSGFGNKVFGRVILVTNHTISGVHVCVCVCVIRVCLFVFWYLPFFFFFFAWYCALLRVFRCTYPHTTDTSTRTRTRTYAAHTHTPNHTQRSVCC